MKRFNILPALSLNGTVILPGDKSIAHRAALLSAISGGRTTLINFPSNADCLATLGILRKLGVKTKKTKSKELIIYGRGLNGLKAPKGPLFVKESGATFRLLLGLLAAQRFDSVLKAGKALSSRPMLRVIRPLRMMGADIPSQYPPIIIKAAKLRGITYKLPLPSAQVKSAVILAGLYAQGKTKIIEPLKTRDHTERMLKVFKGGIKHKGNTIVIEKSSALVSPGKIYIPGDISSAVFFIVAAAILPGSEILLKNVSLNPGRSGALKVLKRMGARINITGRRPEFSGFEPVADITARSSALKATRVRREEAPSLIDELPALMVASCFARGRTVFEGVGELRVKETDRVLSMSENLKKMGADIRVAGRAKREGIIIKGRGRLKAARLKSFGDHRTAMSLIIAGLAAGGESSIDDVSCINKSFPGFIGILELLRNNH